MPNSHGDDRFKKLQESCGSHQPSKRGQLLAGLQGPLGRFFVMAKGFSLITVGLAVGAAWYLRNVAFPGEFVRAADSPTPRRGRAGRVELPRRRRRVAPERVMRPGSHQTHERARAPPCRENGKTAASLTQKQTPTARTTRNQRRQVRRQGGGHVSSEEILARYDNYYSGATDWDTAQQPAHDEHNNAAAAERYFTLITDFFEYGWGDAFHMAPLGPDWSFKRSMAYWEQNFVLTAGIQRDMKVADLGMGIGGPMRRVVEFTGANMTGVTICQHQVNRANQITSTLPEYIQDRTEYLVGDYNDLPSSMKPSSYDAAYFMESLSHSEDRAIPSGASGQNSQARRHRRRLAVDAEAGVRLRQSSPHGFEKRGMEYGGGCGISISRTRATRSTKELD